MPCPACVNALVERLVDLVAAAEPVVATQLGLAEHAASCPTSPHPAMPPTWPTCSRAAAAPRRSGRRGGGTDAIDAATGGQIARRVERAYGTRGVQRLRPGLYLDAAYGVLLLMIKEVAAPAERVAALRARPRGAAGGARGGPRQPARTAAAALRARRRSTTRRASPSSSAKRRRAPPPSSAGPAPSTPPRRRPPPRWRASPPSCAAASSARPRPTSPAAASCSSTCLPTSTCCARRPSRSPRSAARRWPTRTPP